MSDARVTAWIGAWDCLEAAIKLQEEHSNRTVELTTWLDQLYRQAEIFAALAAVEPEVGAAAGNFLRQRKEQDKQQREMLRDFLTPETEAEVRADV